MSSRRHDVPFLRIALRDVAAGAVFFLDVCRGQAHVAGGDRQIIDATGDAGVEGAAARDEDGADLAAKSLRERGGHELRGLRLLRLHGLHGHDFSSIRSAASSTMTRYPSRSAALSGSPPIDRATCCAARVAREHARAHRSLRKPNRAAGCQPRSEHVVARHGDIEPRSGARRTVRSRSPLVKHQAPIALHRPRELTRSRP